MRPYETTLLIVRAQREIATLYKARRKNPESRHLVHFWVRVLRPLQEKHK